MHKQISKEVRICVVFNIEKFGIAFTEYLVILIISSELFSAERTKTDLEFGTYSKVGTVYRWLILTSSYLVSLLQLKSYSANSCLWLWHFYLQQYNCQLTLSTPLNSNYHIYFFASEFNSETAQWEQVSTSQYHTHSSQFASLAKPFLFIYFSTFIATHSKWVATRLLYGLWCFIYLQND